MDSRLRNKLILRRLEKVYCRLAPSPIHGIGVFAIRDIPKGTNPFSDSFMAQGAIVVKKNTLRDFGPEMLELLNDYHPSDSNNQVISNFPNQPIWTNYINYSDSPNIELMTNGEWVTLRDISKGEEVVEDPKRLFNADGSQKVFNVKPNQYPGLSY